MLPANPTNRDRRPTVDDVLMQTALAFQERSTCSRNQVGAVIALTGRIISTGYNGAPAGMAHCDHTYAGAYDMIRPRPLEQNLLRDLIADKTKIKGCQTAIHAEANAIAYAARHGMSLENTTIYTTLSPCFACAQLIVAAGLARVVYLRTYRDRSGVDLLTQADVIVDQMDPLW